MKSIVLRSCVVALVIGALGARAWAAEPRAALPATLDLQTALSLALQRNIPIQQARARYAEATGALRESQAGRLPTVTASGTYNRVADSLTEGPAGFSISDTTWQAGVQAQQTVYSGGAVSSSISARRAAREAAAAAFEEAVQSALLDVRVRFFDVLLAREQVGVQEEAIRLLEEELANARARVRAGSGSPFDELRAEVALANGQPALIRARNTYRVAAVDLLRAIGVPSSEEAADIVLGQLEFVEREVSLEQALASARENRPEIRRLEQLVAAAESSVDVARAGGRPALAVVGGYSVQKSQFASSNSDSVDGWNVGLQASWNIFDGRATRSRVEQARAFLEQTRLGLEDTILAIDADVRRSYASWRDAIELVNASHRVVEQAEESLRLARSRFSAGAATQLDVLTAQVALTEARSNVAEALHAVTVAYAFLERSAGLAPLPESVQLTPAE